jgi:hypothetical protein
LEPPQIVDWELVRVELLAPPPTNEPFPDAVLFEPPPTNEELAVAELLDPPPIAELRPLAT